jgi:DNA-binding GntR family transcriptional regulator
MSNLETYFTKQKVHPGKNGVRRRREVAYERIKDAIQHAGLEPGEPLSELQLSKLLGISRTPVREALQQLAQEGMVQVIPGRAVTVASRSVKDVLDVVHMRTLLEPELARLAAENASESQIEALQDAINRMEAALPDDDYAAWSKADKVFHDTINQACPNPLLGETVVLLRNRVHHLANTDSKHNPARLAACTAEHREVVDAIAQHNSKAAEQAMRDHLNKLRESLFNKLTYGQ